MLEGGGPEVGDTLETTSTQKQGLAISKKKKKKVWKLVNKDKNAHQ